MFDVRKDFSTNKAYRLLNRYERKGYTTKAQFISELIKMQEYFGSKSILGQDLLLNGYFRERTARLVLWDLGYDLINFKNETDSYFFKKPLMQHTIVAFSSNAEGD